MQPVRFGGETVGHLEGAMPTAATATVTVRLRDGRAMRVPASMLRPDHDGVLRATDDFMTAARSMVAGERQVVPLAAERLRIEKRRRTDRVLVRVRPVERQETVDIPLVTEHIEVERVPCDRLVDGPQPVRQEGDLMVVPVLEEVLVIEKRLRVREEVHIRRVRTTERAQRAFTLRQEEVEVHRTGEERGA